MKAFLESLSEDEQTELAAIQEDRTYQDREVLFRQGEPADGAYVLRSGALTLWLSVPGGEPVPVSRVDAGTLLGEPALLRAATRSLEARAVGDVEVGFIHRRDFQGLRSTFRPVSFRLILDVARTAAQRLQVSDRATTRAMGSEAGCTDPAEPLDAPPPDFDPRPFLRHLPFFEEFTPSDLDQLLERGRLHSVRRGRPVVRRGQASQRCWVVVRGAVEARNGVGRRVGLFGPGSGLGFLAPLLGTPANADCTMREDGVLLELGPEAFAELTTPSSRVAFKFTNAMALSLLRALSRANRVLARAELERRTT